MPIVRLCSSWAATQQGQPQAGGSALIHGGLDDLDGSLAIVCQRDGVCLVEA
jgi:hypothetical protein